MRSVISFILQTSLSVCSCPSAPPEIVRWPQTDSGHDPGWRREDCSHSRLSGPREDPDPAAESSREMVWPAGQGQRQVKPLTAKVAQSGIYSLCWWQKDALMRSSEKPDLRILIWVTMRLNPALICWTEKYARSTNTGSSFHSFNTRFQELSTYLQHGALISPHKNMQMWVCFALHLQNTWELLYQVLWEEPRSKLWWRFLFLVPFSVVSAKV